MKIILTKKFIKEKYAVKNQANMLLLLITDKILIVFSATSGGVCNISSVSVVGAPIGKAGASFTLIFSLRTGIIEILLSITKNKRKTMIRFLYWLKVN